MSRSCRVGNVDELTFDSQLAGKVLAQRHDSVPLCRVVAGRDEDHAGFPGQMNGLLRYFAREEQIGTCRQCCLEIVLRSSTAPGNTLHDPIRVPYLQRLSAQYARYMA